MRNIKITFPDNSTIEAGHDIKPITILNHFSTDLEKIIAVKVNNEICSLESSIDVNAKLEPIVADSKEGAVIYRRSLCFLLAYASHKLFPEERLLVGHSIAYGYYYTFDKMTDVSQERIDALRAEMQKAIDDNKIIETEFLSYEDACTVFENEHLEKTRKQMNFRCPTKIRVNTIDGFSDLYFGPLVVSAGYLKTFEILKYKQGFLLRFPRHDIPGELPEFKDQPKLFEIYKNYKNWGKMLEVTSVADLNELIQKRKIDDFVNITETLQTKCMADIASQIQARGTARCVLIAGPSSSGKTTTSKKLSLQLEALGYRPKVISLDSYYRGHDKTPRDENGKLDFECLEALNVELLNDNLVDLFKGKEIDLPYYDFSTGTSTFRGEKMHLDANDILVMEGIHGLNDRLTPLVPAEMKFKIYISALTQLNLDDHNRISTSDNRLIRRIVRDARFRGKSAAGTIAMWDSVQKGERLHIFPFQSNADAMLNTALDYEMAVLKVYASPLLRCVSPMVPEYAEADRLLHFLDCFSQVPANAVPNQSIIREFIGGSAFHY